MQEKGLLSSYKNKSLFISCAKFCLFIKSGELYLTFGSVNKFKR